MARRASLVAAVEEGDKTALRDEKGGRVSQGLRHTATSIWMAVQMTRGKTHMIVMLRDWVHQPVKDRPIATRDLEMRMAVEAAVKKRSFALSRSLKPSCFVRILDLTQTT